MPVEDDLSCFSYYSSMMSIMNTYREELPIYETLKKLNERSSIFIEMMGAAFIQETGLKVSEVELICHIEMDSSIHWSFQKKVK